MDPQLAFALCFTLIIVTVGFLACLPLDIHLIVESILKVLTAVAGVALNGLVLVMVVGGFLGYLGLFICIWSAVLH